jgi:ketosteroid isomerase-like protein
MEDSRFQEVVDKQDIAEVLSRYVLSQDAHDWAAFATCFTPDASYVHPKGEIHGIDAITDRSRRALEPLTASQHMLGSVLVTLDGDEADAISYFVSQHVRIGAPGGDLYAIGGTYRDRLTRTPEGWKIARRVQDYSWKDGNPDVVIR